jgi:asparagine synthase (glutamine-hydrolysing)
VASFSQARNEFRRLLAEAVARQLDGSRPAAFLSGGTDSSTVAGLIGEVSGRPAATYSIGFDAKGYDEMAYARIAAQRFGCEHHEYYVTPDDLVQGIPALAAHHDQPFGNSSALPAYICALRAREDGVTRLLAGDGGDELFGGNTRYAKQRVFDWYQLVPAGLRSGLLEPLSSDGGALDRLPLLRKGASYVRQARVPMPDRLQTYNLLQRLGQTDVLTPCLSGARGPRRPGAPGARRLAAERRDQLRQPDAGLRLALHAWPRTTCPRCAAVPSWPASPPATPSWTRRWSTSPSACPPPTSSRA